MCLIAEKDPLKNAQSLMRNLITKFGKKLMFQTDGGGGEGRKLGTIVLILNEERIITKAA